MGRLLSIILIGISGYFVYQNRYRALNIIFKNAMIRKILVGSFMGIPGIRNRLMNLVFPSGPAETT